MGDKLLRLSLGSALLCLTTLGAAPGMAGSDQYRWVNQQGNEVFSDRPPPAGTDYEVISEAPGLKRVAPDETESAPAAAKAGASEHTTRVDATEAQHSKKDPELCKRAQADLQVLSGDTRVKVRDKEGKEKFLSDEEVIVQREKARAEVSVYCP